MSARTAAGVRSLTRKSLCPVALLAPLRPHTSSAVIGRFCSSEPTQRVKAPKRSTFRPAADSTHDWIGPPNPLSNLRPIVYHVAEDESALEGRLRRLRQETEDWNHEFWTQQNITFTKEKEAFIISHLKAEGLTVRDEQGRRRALGSEDMARFYKSFLDTNRMRHVNYNKEWYRRNFTITFLMARVALSSMWRTVARKRNSSSTSSS